MACEAYYTEDELVDGQLPDPRPPGRVPRGGELLLQALRVRAAAARLVRGRPRRRAARGQAQRGARPHPPGPARTSRSRRTSHRLGRAGARGTPATSSTSGTTPSSTTPPRSATAPTPSGSTTWWPASTTSSARTSSGSTACTGRRCCWRPGSSPAEAHQRARLPAGRRREDVARPACNQIAPADLVADFGVDGFRYHFLRDTPFGPDGDFTYEGMVDRYNTDLANNLGNLPVPGGHGRGQEVRRRRPGAAPGQPAGRGRRRGLRRDGRGLGPGAAVASRSRPPGGSSARPTPTSRPTSRGRPSPGPRSTPCSATPSRCCASWRSWPRPPCPTPARRSGAASASTGRPEDQRLPEAAAWGGYPGGLPVEKGDAALPPPVGLNAGALDRQPLPPRSSRPDRRRRRGRRARRRRRAGVTGSSTSAPTWPTRRRPPTVAAAHAGGVGHRRRPPPRRPARPRRPRGAPRPRRGAWPWGSAGSTTTTTTRPATCSARCSPPRSRWPTARPGAGDPHPRGVGRHLRRARRGRRARAHRVPLLHRRRSRRPSGPRPRRPPVLQRHRDLSRRPTTCGTRPGSAPSTGCWSRPTRRTWRRCRTGASPTTRAWSPWSARGWPRSEARSRRWSPTHTWANATRVYDLPD